MGYKNMVEFSSGQYIIFKNELADKLFSEGYLLRRIYEKEPIKYWIITEDRDYKNRVINKIDEMPDDEFYNNSKTIIVKELFIKPYSDKTVCKFNKIENYLHNKIISSNVNINYERHKTFVGGNKNILITINAIKKIIYKPLLIFYHIILIGLIKLILGGLFDYFKNLYRIFTIKQEIKEEKKYAYLSEYLNKVNGINHDAEENKLEKELKNLEEKGYNIYNSLIAIIIAVVSLIISIVKE